MARLCTRLLLVSAQLALGYTPKQAQRRGGIAATPDYGDASQPRASTTELTSKGAPSAPVQFVVIAASPRSASTSVAETIADHRCSISFNEMFSHRGGNLWHPQGMRGNALGCLYPVGPPCESIKGGCQSGWYRGRFHHALDTMIALSKSYCNRKHNDRSSPAPSCNGKCVIAIKLFGPDQFANDKRELYFNAYKDSLAELMTFNGTRVVVVERDAADDECSYNYSKRSGVWHGGNKKLETAWKNHNCRTQPSPRFAYGHKKWYDWVRDTMKKNAAPSLELPFETFIEDVPDARRRLRKFADLPDEPEFDQPGCGKTPSMRFEEYERPGSDAA